MLSRRDFQTQSKSLVNRPCLMVKVSSKLNSMPTQVATVNYIIHIVIVYVAIVMYSHIEVVSC